jgi:hypothetical protein
MAVFSHVHRGNGIIRHDCQASITIGRGGLLLSLKSYSTNIFLNLLDGVHILSAAM